MVEDEEPLWLAVERILAAAKQSDRLLREEEILTLCGAARAVPH